MGMAMLALSLAFVPPPGLPYYAHTEYLGPGLVCGSAYSVRLSDGERAVLTKRSFVDNETHFDIREGEFDVRETQYADDGGTIVRELDRGTLRLKREGARYIWIYRDHAPGSTEIYGPAVSTSSPSPALDRIRFGATRGGTFDGEPCLTGTRSNKKAS